MPQKCNTDVINYNYGYIDPRNMWEQLSQTLNCIIFVLIIHDQKVMNEPRLILTLNVNW